MTYYPLFHNSKQLHVLIVGGGRIALRRAKALLKTGATCDLIAPEVHTELAELIRDHGGRVTQQAFHADWLNDQYQLVLALTNDNAVNAHIAEQAKQQGLMVNVANDASVGNVAFGATIDRSPLTIAINNGGTSPVLSRLLRQQLEQFIPKHYGQLAELVGKYRDAVKQALPKEGDRVGFWEGVLHGAVAEALFSGQHDVAEELLKKALQQADNILAMAKFTY